MHDDETKGGFTVSDKRRIKIDDAGNVVTNPEQSDRTPEASAAAEKAPDVSTQAKFEDECEPCQADLEELPPIDFTSFVFSMTTSAMICLGMLPDPQTKEEFIDLAMAKQNIDILGMLQEKTKGNLTKEEEEFLNHSLYDLRLRFVTACTEKS
jgi:hypothetical protein